MQYFIVFCSRPEAASDVISDKFVRPLSSISAKNFEIRAKPFSRNSIRSRRRRYFRQFFHYNFGPEVNSDVISGVAEDYIRVDATQNLVLLRQTVFEIFEVLISCRTNEQNEAYPNSAKRVSPTHGKRYTIGVNGEPIVTHGRGIEWAHPLPP